MRNNNDEVKLIGKMLMTHNGSIFVEQGKFGIKDTDENVLVPANYDQIEKCFKYIYILKDGYLTLYSERSIRSWNIKNQEDGYVYAECGKLGWKELTGNILIPAAYDEIYRWGTSLYAVQKDGRWYYINGRQKEVLKDFTPIDGEDEEEPPFELSANSNKILTVLEYVGHEIENDSNVVTLDNMWVRMQRMTGEEIAHLLVNSEDECPMTEKDLALYNNSFSYEFNVYAMRSTRGNGICDCMRQAYKMNAFSNSWHYLIKVWKAPGEEPTAAELRMVRYYTDKKQRIGQLKFALGHDSSLNPGETKMLMVTHYNERCFPPSIEFNWTDFLNEQSLEIIKANIPELRKIVEETYQPEYIDEVWWDMLHDRINDINYCAGRTWEETEKVLDYFKKDDTTYLHSIHWTIERFMDCDTSQKNPRFYMNKLEWLLKNGANVNTFKDGETGLDLLNKSPRTFLNEHPVDDNVISECKKLMIQNGALTMKELREKEALNNDYLIELRRMSL